VGLLQPGWKTEWKELLSDKYIAGRIILKLNDQDVDGWTILRWILER
jgi:hypothetical protein